MKIFCKFLTVNFLPFLPFYLVKCTAKNFIWTTLKMIFSIFRFFFAPSDSRFSNLYLGKILSDPNKTYINGNIIYSAFRCGINLNIEKFTLKTVFLVQGHICKLHSKHNLIQCLSERDQNLFQEI